MFDRITIIGLGLIGSSIARAVRERGLAGSVVGCDSNEMALAYARKNEFIDVAMYDAAASVEGSELVILAVPPFALGNVARAIAPSLRAGAVVMDVCSVKLAVMEILNEALSAEVHVIPAHPIAGSEKSGGGAGRGDLFEGKRVIVTPDEPVGEALRAVTAFWQVLGARIEGMPAHLHDLIYGYVSHLPQLLAFAAYGTLGEPGDDAKLAQFLRLGRSDTRLWMQIFLLNRDDVVTGLDRYLDVIHHIAGELTQGEDEASPQDAQLARSVLFPRIAASCLITTVMEAEKKLGLSLVDFSFARYAGAGFADFTAAAMMPPEEDIERISGQHKAVAGLLEAYMERLKAIREAVMREDEAEVIRALSFSPLPLAGEVRGLGAPLAP